MSIESKHSYRFGFLKSEEWEGHRKIILAERNAKCAVCGHKDWSNDVHHIVYRRGLSLKNRADFQVLCRTCHAIVHVIMNHRERMGAKYKGHNFGWKNTKRSAKRIIKVSEKYGPEIALLRAQSIFDEIYSNRVESKRGIVCPEKVPARASQTDSFGVPISALRIPPEKERLPARRVAQTGAESINPTLKEL